MKHLFNRVVSSILTNPSLAESAAWAASLAILNAGPLPTASASAYLCVALKKMTDRPQVAYAPQQ